MEPKPVTTPKKSSFSDLLKQPVSLKKKTVKYPTKTTLNLNMVQQDKAELYRMIPVYLLLGIAVLAGVKFGILDRYQAVASARAELASYQQQVNDMDEKLKDFAAVQEKYQRYTKNSQTQQEATLIDRLALVGMLDQSAQNLVSVSSIAISKNMVTIQITTSELAKVASYKALLDQSDLVLAASVYNADTVEDENAGTQHVRASIVVTLNQEVVDE